MKKRTISCLSWAISAICIVAFSACQKSDGDGSVINKAVAREASSGTREVFEERVQKDGVSLKDYLKDGTQVYPHAVQELNSTNGVIMEVTARYDTLGYVSLGSYLENTERLQLLSVDGVYPTAETVQTGSYPIYRTFLLAYQNATYEENGLLQNFIDYIESAEGQKLIAEDYITLPDLTVKRYEPYSGVQKKLTVGGSTSVGPIVKALADSFMRRNPAVTVTVEENGSGTGIQKALDGDYQIAMSSRALKPQESKSLQGRAIALDGVVVVVKKGSRCKDVSLAQLFDLYTALKEIRTE